jgi:lysophospholipase L1-like esterase
MLDRFNSLIPGHGYKIVVILGGTNDVLQGIDPSITIHNLEEIGERTTEQHAEPILCEIPPIFHTSNPADRKNYDPHVRELNIRIAQLAATHHWKQVDYYSPLVNRPSFSNDGVHMTRGGYLVMEWTLLHQIPVF